MKNLENNLFSKKYNRMMKVACVLFFCITANALEIVMRQKLLRQRDVLSIKSVAERRNTSIESMPETDMRKITRENSLIRNCAVRYDSLFDSMLKILETEYEFGNTRQRYRINPESVLNIAIGQLFHDSNILKNKKQLSCRTKTEYAKTQRNGEFNDNITSLEYSPCIFNSKNSTLSDSYCKYTFDYHSSLLNIFKSRNGGVSMVNEDPSSLYNFLNSLNTKDAANMLALLILLSENLNLDKSIFIITDGNKRDKLIFKHKKCGFEIEFPNENSPHGCASKEEIMQIISFFSNCSKNSEYKKIISDRFSNCKRNKYDVIHLLETPYFLQQVLLYEFFESRKFRNYSLFVKSVLRILFTCLDIESKKNKIFSKYFVRADKCDAIDYSLYRDYGTFLRSLREKSDPIFSYFRFSEPLKPIVTRSYDRKTGECVQSRFYNSAETVILTILSFIFYDRESRQFDLSHLKSGEYSTDKNLLEFFRTYNTPDALYQDVNTTMESFNRVLQDLPNTRIEYLQKEVSRNTRYVVKNKLSGKISNILCVIAHLIGNCELSKMIELNCAESLVFNEEFFNKIGCRGKFTISTGPEELYSENGEAVQIFDLCCKSNNYTLRIKACGSESWALCVPRIESNGLIKRLENSLRTHRCSLLSDLIQKTLDFKIKPYFITKDPKKPSEVALKIREIVENAKKEPDYLITFYDTIRMLLSDRKKPFLQETLFFLDLLRPLAMSDAFEKKTEFCKFMINFTFFVAREVESEEIKSFFFIMLLGVDRAHTDKILSSAYVSRFIRYLYANSGISYSKMHDFSTHEYPCMQNLSFYLLNTVYSARISHEISDIILNFGGFSDRSDDGTSFFKILMVFVLRHSISSCLDIIGNNHPEDPCVLADLHCFYLANCDVFDEIVFIAESFMRVSDEKPVDLEHCRFLDFEKSKIHWQRLRELYRRHRDALPLHEARRSLSKVWAMYEHINMNLCDERYADGLKSGRIFVESCLTD